MARPDIHQRLVERSQKPRTVLGRPRHQSDLASEGMHRALLSRDPRNSQCEQATCTDPYDSMRSAARFPRVTADLGDVRSHIRSLVALCESLASQVLQMLGAYDGAIVTTVEVVYMLEQLGNFSRGRRVDDY